LFHVKFFFFKFTYLTSMIMSSKKTDPDYSTVIKNNAFKPLALGTGSQII